MKALSLTQPWATLIALGAKKIETRSWPTLHRGPLAIHAAKGLGSVGGTVGLTDLCATEPFRSVLDRVWQPPGTFFAPRCLAFGSIVAVCELYDCRPTGNEAGAGRRGWERESDGTFWELTEQERAFGDYSPGRFAWLLSSVVALSEPIPARGALGLWDWQPPKGWTL